MSIFCINDKRTDQNRISEEISSHQNSAQLTFHKCDIKEINIVNTDEEVDVTSVHAINATNDISKNDDLNHIHKY